MINQVKINSCNARGGGNIIRWFIKYLNYSDNDLRNDFRHSDPQIIKIVIKIADFLLVIVVATSSC